MQAATATKHGGEKDARLQYLSWRIWHLKRKQADVEWLKHGGEGLDGLQYALSPIEPPSRDYSSEEESTAEPCKGITGPGLTEIPVAKTETAQHTTGFALPSHKLSVRIGDTVTHQPAESSTIDALLEDYMLSSHDATPLASQMDGPRLDRLYVVMISLHGLVRGERMELGRDSDTGGQVKYVVELARAMALHPAVYRVDLLTRLIKDPRVDSDYGQEEECLAKGSGDLGGAYIVRLPCGPTNEYIAKELLWPHVREFADHSIAHIQKTLQMLADSGRRCELYCVHGHYADAGEVAVLMCSTLDVQMVMTGHSLGRNKLEHLLANGTLTRSEIETTYHISRRIEAEEKCLDVATMVFTSTQQEIDEQWGLYDGYDPSLARILRFHTAYGRHMPVMKVSPPGLDFSMLKVTMPEDPVLKEFEEERVRLAGLDLVPLSPLSASAMGRKESKEDDGSEVTSPSTKILSTSPASLAPSSAPGDPLTHVIPPRPGEIIPNGPPIWQEIARFLRNPLKPAILAMSRPDSKKNIATLVKAFGEHSMLRELANLVLIMGNRDAIDSMAIGSQKVLVQVLKMIDAYDLYGSVAYPKHHTQQDISDIYLFARETRGVFVNIALQEPFGLTVIEAAAHGVPTVATENGGPVDIMATLHHGVVVDPTDKIAVANALLSILTDPQRWDAMSLSGINNIMAYSWPAHCKRYMEAMDAEQRLAKRPYRHDRTMSGLLDKKLSRVDLVALGTQEPSPMAVGKQDRSLGSDMHRRFSTPGDITTAAANPSLETISPQVPVRKVSGLTVDDLDILQGIDAASKHASSNGYAGERASFIVITIDSDKVLSEIAKIIKSVMAKISAGKSENVTTSSSVGIGVLSMLGFDSTYHSLLNNGVEIANIDFMVCNSGADVWLQQEGSRWDADETYESLIGFHWDRIALHRTLKKIVSSPGKEGHRRLPRLKELLYNVAEEPEAGVHPHHLCLELDPETQGILTAGIGPRAKTASSGQLVTTVVERLKRRLRSKGFRAHYTLQIVPHGKSEQKEQISVLHITPTRASRSLALRAIAHRLNLSMKAFNILLLPPHILGSTCDDAVVYAATSDTMDLIAGAQSVFIAKGGEESKSEDRQLAIHLSPFQGCGRVHLLERSNLVDQLVGTTVNRTKS